ncbi:FAD-dependent oxidoreductase [Fodinicurvata sp. EGI_FJ10296]|uniref:NAD(P)/FAD-dependent oxidoreductase n=1 Tax=Fodinicurvata sp. EGI_FJ10296 TaxID=3231908 RepID=UPI003453327C
MPKAPVIIVGAGVVGMATAVFLRRDGHDVTVIDPAGPGEGCSYGNAGSISPDMVIPMAMPGMMTKIPRWLFDPLGPLAIKPRYFPRALPWLLRWIESGRGARVRTLSSHLRTLHRPVFELYRELLGNAAESHIRTAGQLYVWRGLEATSTELLSDALREVAGVHTEAVDAGQLREMEPALGEDFRRGLYFPDNGHTADPRALVRALAEEFERAGGVIASRKAEGFEIGPSGVTAVRTSDGSLSASAVVIAAGAFSAPLAAAVGARVPLETERGYHVSLPDPGITVNNKLSNREQMFSVTAMENGLRFAGTVEIAGLHAPPVAARTDVLLRHAKAMFPGLRTEGCEVWMGFRPSMPDSLPVIGRAPRIANAWLAFGHGHTGMTGAPMTGRLIADMIAGRPTAVDAAPYSPARFAMIARTAQRQEDRAEDRAA